MHQRTDAPIENAVLLLEAEYPERTAEIVLPAAAIRARMTAHLRVALGRVALAAPFRAGHAQQARQIATMSDACVICDVALLWFWGGMG